jgi:ankyrin repeat protein
VRVLTLGHAGGESALTIAFKEGRDDIVELLAKANITVCDIQGSSALHLASEGRGNSDLVHRLLKHGADAAFADRVRAWAYMKT